ncbi:hypothetical protein RI367_003742 [Sorochytrium milnesiophthora]
MDKLVLCSLLVAVAVVSASYPGDTLLTALFHSAQPWAKSIQPPKLSQRTLQALTAFVAAAQSSSIESQLDRSHNLTWPDFGKCQLPSSNTVQLLPPASSSLNSYFVDCFLGISHAAPYIHIDRFDLWHAHLFVNGNTTGLLFHAHEYPAYSATSFPYQLGYCQANSTLVYSKSEMQARNVLWMVRSEGDKLLPPTMHQLLSTGRTTGSKDIDNVLGQPPFYTVYEDDLGHVIGDLYYLPNEPLSFDIYDAQGDEATSAQ